LRFQAFIAQSFALTLAPSLEAEDRVRRLEAWVHALNNLKDYQNEIYELEEEIEQEKEEGFLYTKKSLEKQLKEIRQEHQPVSGDRGHARNKQAELSRQLEGLRKELAKSRRELKRGQSPTPGSEAKCF